jgi:hypothetical protein
MQLRPRVLLGQKAALGRPDGERRCQNHAFRYGVS